VVVATDFDPQKGYYDFWAQDPGGGQGSGMVFRDYRDSAVALTLSEGDVVEVTGVYVENKGRSSINFSSAKTSGSQKTVKPDPLKPKEVVEAWEGCLVFVKGTFKVTDVAGTYTWEVQDEDGTRLLVDRLLFDPADTVKVGDSLTTLTGIVYAWIEGTTVNLSLAPRAAGDLKP
jgi:hypothetical protein